MIPKAPMYHGTFSSPVRRTSNVKRTLTHSIIAVGGRYKTWSRCYRSRDRHAHWSWILSNVIRGWEINADRQGHAAAENLKRSRRLCRCCRPGKMGSLLMGDGWPLLLYELGPVSFLPDEGRPLLPVLD